MMYTTCRMTLVAPAVSGVPQASLELELSVEPFTLNHVVIGSSVGEGFDGKLQFQ